MLYGLTRWKDEKVAFDYVLMPPLSKTDHLDDLEEIVLKTLVKYGSQS